MSDLPIIPRRTGFSLVELLVVVAILVVLLSILLPSLGKAREAARSVRCATNIGAQLVALHMYSNENDEFYPGTHVTLHGAAAVWFTRIRQYVGSKYEVFNCTKVTAEYHWKRKSRGNTLTDLLEYGYEHNEDSYHLRTPFSYGMNDWGIREFTDPHLGMGNHVNNRHDPRYGEIDSGIIVSPSNFIAIGDTVADRVWDFALDPNDPPSYKSERPSKRHNDGSNVGFDDGHVQWFTQLQLIMPTTEMYRKWNNDNNPHTNIHWYGP